MQNYENRTTRKVTMVDARSMHGDWQRGGDVAGLSSRSEGGSDGVSWCFEVTATGSLTRVADQTWESPK